MPEHAELVTITKVIFELTGDETLNPQLVGSDLIIFRDAEEIGKMIWNPAMTARQRQRIAKIAGGINA